MTDRRRGLGRGLGALIPTARAEDAVPSGRPTPLQLPAAVHHDRNGMGAVTDIDPGPAHRLHAADVATAAAPGHPAVTASAADETRDGQRDVGARYAEIDVASIRVNPRQPRQVFDEEALAELVHSIREIGVLQPVVVRELTEAGTFELVMGERRWRAARDAGLDTIPAIIRETADTALLRDALLENLHRAQLNPLEEAAAYDQLLQDFGCTQEELSARIGRSRPQISNTLRLLRLPPSVQRRLAAGVLSAGHSRALLGLGDQLAQERLAQRIVAEGLSVRSVEEIVAVGVGATTQRGPVVRTPRRTTGALAEAAARLSGRFDTRVRVDMGRTKGRITVEFASLPDLERIVDAMDPAAAAGPP